MPVGEIILISIDPAVGEDKIRPTNIFLRFCHFVQFGERTRFFQMKCPVVGLHSAPEIAFVAQLTFPQKGFQYTNGLGEGEDGV